jgi:hypothetical protein
MTDKSERSKGRKSVYENQGLIVESPQNQLRTGVLG